MQTTTAAHDWYTVVTFGRYDGQPTGPWHGEAAAGNALDRWADRKGSAAGTLMAASSTRIVGPFCSRAAARNADISDYIDHACPHQ